MINHSQLVQVTQLDKIYEWFNRMYGRFILFANGFYIVEC